MCCNTDFSVEEFVAHSSDERCIDRPWCRLRLKDNRSLAKCLDQLMKHDNFVTNAPMLVKMKRECSDPHGDSICFDGGELLICDHCPTTFHFKCLGLQGVPPDAKPASAANLTMLTPAGS
ncbi:hypothetical protein EJB05_42951, partial [Eragrostis curvula]